MSFSHDAAVPIQYNTIQSLFTTSLEAKERSQIQLIVTGSITENTMEDMTGHIKLLNSHIMLQN